MIYIKRKHTQVRQLQHILLGIITLHQRGRSLHAHDVYVRYTLMMCTCVIITGTQHIHVSLLGESIVIYLYIYKYIYINLFI